MTDIIPAKPLPEAVPARSAPMQVTGKLKVAIDGMIWQGLTRDEAAIAAGMKPHSLYIAFRKSHVKAYYLQELGVLRTSERARTFHRLTKLRDQDENKNAAVSAAKALEGIEDAEHARPGGPMQQMPGLTVVINVPVGRAPPIDVTPRPAEIEPGTGFKVPHPEPAFRRRGDE